VLVLISVMSMTGHNQGITRRLVAKPVLRVRIGKPKWSLSALNHQQDRCYRCVNVGSGSSTVVDAHAVRSPSTRREHLSKDSKIPGRTRTPADLEIVVARKNHLWIFIFRVQTSEIAGIRVAEAVDEISCGGSFRVLGDKPKLFGVDSSLDITRKILQHPRREPIPWRRHLSRKLPSDICRRYLLPKFGTTGRFVSNY